MDPAFPAHSFLLGADRYGLTQLQDLDRLPATGAVLVVLPLPIVTGTGSPARAIALLERRLMRSGPKPSWSAAPWPGSASGHAFGVVGSGNFVLTNALRSSGVPVRRGPARGRGRDVDGRRVRPDQRPGQPAVGPPGLRADECDDRNHGGGQEPDAAARAGRGRRRPPRSARTSGIDQDALVRAASAPVPERVHSAGAGARADVVRAWRTGAERTADGGAQRAAGSAGGRGTTMGGAVRSTRCRRPVRRRRPRGRGPPRGGWSPPGEPAGLPRRPRRGRPRRRGLAGPGGGERGAAGHVGGGGKGLFAGDPFDLGVSGGFASPVAAALIPAADLVVGLGQPADHVDHPARQADPRAASVVQVDDDASAIGVTGRWPSG